MVSTARKPRAGVALMSAEWFLSVGLAGGADPAQAELTGAVEGDIKRVLAVLEPHFDLVYPGPITSRDHAESAARRFRAEGAELLILVNVMWSEDGPLVSLLRGLAGVPVLLWCYNPYSSLPEKMSTGELFRASGAVGFLQSSAPLARMGIRFSYVFGHPGDGKVAAELAEYSRAFSCRTALSGLRMGQVGPRSAAMTGSYIDEFRLLTSLGVSLVPISAWRLAEEAKGVPKAAVSELIRWLKGKYPIRGVSDASLELAARASLAVAAVAEKECLGAVAIEDLNPELHALLKTRPCLWVPGMEDRGLVVGSENDLVSTLGMWLCRNLGGSTPMYTEIFTFDQEANCLLFGHAGMQDPALAGANPMSIVPDAEYRAVDEVEGAWVHFAARPGSVTMVSLFAAAQKYRTVLFAGEVLPVKEKLEGFAHAFVKVEQPLSGLFAQLGKLGMSQHFAISYDPIAGALEKLCSIAGMEWVRI